MKVNNVPAYADNYKYMVAREVDDEWWFWGAYETKEEAYSAAQTLHTNYMVEEKLYEPLERL